MWANSYFGANFKSVIIFATVYENFHNLIRGKYIYAKFKVLIYFYSKIEKSYIFFNYKLLIYLLLDSKTKPKFEPRTGQGYTKDTGVLIKENYCFSVV